MPTFVALLRGINVSGKNLIKMAELKESFERAEFTDVQTYVQSGNIIFKSKASSTEKLAEKISKPLEV